MGSCQGAPFARSGARRNVRGATWGSAPGASSGEVGGVLSPAAMTRRKKPSPAVVHPPYDPADMPRLVEETRRVIADEHPTDSTWWQGLSCWGRLLIPGWTSDNAYATAAVEAHGDTLCVGIRQGRSWRVVEIDRPVGFDPRRVTLADAAEVRLYSPRGWTPGRGWADEAPEVFARKPGCERAF